jgi:predicted Fe-Mo cluster-binding NifX family protein
MGPRAVQILQHFGIEVVLGIEGGEPEQLVRAYLDGTLAASGEGCGGGELHRCDDHGEPRRSAVTPQRPAEDR